jgi:hypothetical protein
VPIDFSMLAGLPGLVALIVCLRRGPASAFLNVYLPVLLLLPDECRMPISGQLNFAESAIIPIAAYYLWKEGKNWEWSFTDFLVLGFASLVTVSEYMDTEYWLAQHLAISMLTTVVLPYIVAKGLIVRERMGVAIAKRITVLATFVAIVSVYQFRMTANPFTDFLSGLFPGIGNGAAFRYGFARISGPWTHPILAGIILAFAYRTARWLEWTGEWHGSVPVLGHIPFLSMSKARFCEIAVVVGSLMTISRGPWLGAGMAAVIMMLIRVRHRTYVTLLAFFAALIVAVPIYYASSSYVSLDRFDGQNEAQESAAYRREMIEQYIVVAEERPQWGWGASETGQGLYPRVENMDSIDNHYLLMALISGMYSLAAMVLILLWVPARLLGFGLRNVRDDPATSLAVTLLGSFILFAIAISTSWLGAQTQPLLFIIAGWSEALLLAPSFVTAKVPVPVREVSYGFERVMV